MLIKITRTSSWDYAEYREMDTLYELRNFCDECGHAVVVAPADPNAEAEALLTVEIYDDWRE